MLVKIVVIGIIGLLCGLMSIYLGSNIENRKNVFSWLKCKNCENKLKLIELKCKCGYDNRWLYYGSIIISELLFILTFYFYGQNNEMFIGFLFVILMISVTVSDMLRRIVPNELIIIFLVLFGILRIFIYPIVWFDAYLGMIIGFGLFYGLAYFGEKFYKQEVLGGGDIKLYAIIGLVLGVELTLLSVFFASLVGYLYARISKKISGEDPYIAFVPFITVGVFISYYFGRAILLWYTSLF